MKRLVLHRLVSNGPFLYEVLWFEKTPWKREKRCESIVDEGWKGYSTTRTKWSQVFEKSLF